MIWRTLPAILIALVSLQCLAQTDNKPHNAAHFYDKGEAALKNKSYRTALAHFNECLRQNPYYTEAYYSRAIARENLGDKQGALTDYNIYLESKPDDKEALFNRAVSRYNFGQWAVAKEDFIKLLSLPESGETNTIFFQTNQSADGTTKVFTAHHNLQSTFLNYLGLIETKLTQYKLAKDYFDQAISLNPNEPDYFLNRGIAHLSSGDSLSAKKDFEEALALNPESSLARHNLAILKKHNTQDDSEKLLTEAIEKNPKAAFSYAERGLIRLKAGNINGALEDYNEAIKLDAKEPDYFLNRGIIKEQQKDLNGALNDYKQVITLKSDYEKGWLNHGNVLVKLNKLNEAIEDYTVALTINPKYGLAYYNRGLTYHRLGKKKEACTDLQTAKKWGAAIESKVMNTICK